MPDRAIDVVLITGGAGFLGRALHRELKKGDVLPVPREVRVLDLEAGALPPRDGVTAITGDIRDPETVGRACEGADLVFHCAALVDWGREPEALLRAVNVDGTRNVIRGCREAGVAGLVHTSTLDVVYRGEPIHGGDESLPYPARHVNAYCRTKAEAEQIVLQTSGLRAAVIRPCSIFGEHDPYHVPPLIEMARRRMLFRVGSGRSRSQHVYVGNVAHAHLLAARSLLEPEGRAAGQVYFVTDFPAENFFDFLEPIVEGAGYRMLPRWLGVPRPLMYGLACALEGTAKVVSPLFRFTPTVTRFAVDFVCLDYTFVSDKAERELGYRPVYGKAEAFARTIDYFRETYQLRSR